MTPNSKRFWYRRKMYAAFEFRLSRRNTAEVNIGVFRRRLLRGRVRMSFGSLSRRSDGRRRRALRVRQDERLSLWFRERIRRISRSSALSGVYLLSDGCRYSYTNAHYTSFSISSFRTSFVPPFSPCSFSHCQCSSLCLLFLSCSFSWGRRPPVALS